MSKILIAPSTFSKISEEPLKIVRSAFSEILINTTGSVLTKKKLIRLIKDVDVVIAGTEKYDKEIFDGAKNLKIISRLGVGIDNIDLEELKRKKVKLFTTRTTPEQAVAELTLGLILNFFRNISLSSSEIKKNIWKKRMGNLLSNKSIGIIGLGRVGKEFIKIMSSFNAKILVYDIKPDKKYIMENKIKLVSFSKLLKTSDVISLHLNALNNSKPMFNKNEFNQMKKNAIIVNTSRGSIINEEDLIYALENKVIGGACLDVFINEPYNGKLLKFNNTILTPHIGSYVSEIRNIMEIEAATSALQFAK